jgi:hypothetical protein
MIVLWGAPGEAPLDAVGQALARLGADFTLLDQRGASDMTVALDIAADGTASGTVVSPERTLDLDRVGALYLRPFETHVACGASSLEDPAYARAAAADAALVAWADLSRAAIVNRPAEMAANNSKPYQLALIARSGFRVPDTLVTTDPAAAQRFLLRHDAVIYKSVSGVRSIVSRLNAADAPSLGSVANCPTQFQAYVPGVDIRVHVIGDAVIVTEIHSDADDYRYASRFGRDMSMTPGELPEAVARACREMVRGMGLLVAGVDLRRTPGGEYFCFEVNPSPGFTFFEAGAGQPIAATIADLLLRCDEHAARSEH